MIKANATIVGTVYGAPRLTQNKEGIDILVIPVTVPVHVRNNNDKEIVVTVAIKAQGVDPLSLAEGVHIEAVGDLIFKNNENDIKLFLDAVGINTFDPAVEKGISGTLSFRGKLGYKIEERKTKNDKPYLLFPAYSAEKIGDEFKYIWVHFMAFDHVREEWMQPKTKASITGELRVESYNDRLSISCRVSDMQEYVKPAYNKYND